MNRAALNETDLPSTPGLDVIIMLAREGVHVADRFKAEAFTVRAMTLLSWAAQRRDRIRREALQGGEGAA